MKNGIIPAYRQVGKVPPTKVGINSIESPKNGFLVLTEPSLLNLLPFINYINRYT